MSSSNSALPQGSTVLVTGGSGLVGSHIVDQVLAQGFNVRVTTRSVEKAAWMQDFFGQRHPKSKLELAEVADFDDADALDKAMAGVSGLVHAASVLNMSPNPHEVVPLTVSLVQKVLEAAARQSSIKRVVYTSSCTAIAAPQPGVEFHIDDTMWNEADVKAAWAPPPYDQSRGYVVYAASKTSAEKAAWEFMATKKPGFVLSTVLPGTCFGKILTSQAAGITANFARMAFFAAEEGKAKLEETPVVFIPAQWMVDVEDVGKLHVIGLLDPEADGKRLLAYGHKFNWTKIMDTYSKLHPDRKLAQPPANEPEDLSTVDLGAAPALLEKWYGQDGFAPFAQTLARNIEPF